jgi:hypothetical protein
MNNGVSITADTVDVDLPASKQKVKVRLKGMQIINGCQTVNALYHAKYAPELKDRFQGNSNVLVRIYQVEPANKAFLDALIIATNSQNAIRPEDLLSNDNIQKAMQKVYHDYGIGYERKEGETLPGHGYWMTFSKEQAAMAYLGVYEGKTSKLRNSLSRREFFREGDDYYKAFNLRGEEGETQPGPLPDAFEPDEKGKQRALQILVARCLEESCRSGIAAIQEKREKGSFEKGSFEEKREKGSLRKGAYYLARIVYLKKQRYIDDLVTKASSKDQKADVARGLSEAVTKASVETFDDARNTFNLALKDYLDSRGGNEDAALKNSEFARLVDTQAETVSQ